MACPYFLPREKTWNVAWPFPRRLPLGAGFCGTCTAGAEPVSPSDQELKDFCNLGYAKGCSRFPADRSADAVRFAIAKHAADRIVLQYVSELAHAPVENGTLEYDTVAQQWLVKHANACTQRQAECYVAGYLERKQSAADRVIR